MNNMESGVIEVHEYALPGSPCIVTESRLQSVLLANAEEPITARPGRASYGARHRN
jgi:hypothetical protein